MRSCLPRHRVWILLACLLVGMGSSAPSLSLAEEAPAGNPTRDAPQEEPQAAEGTEGSATPEAEERRGLALLVLLVATPIVVFLSGLSLQLLLLANFPAFSRRAAITVIATPLTNLFVGGITLIGLLMVASAAEQGSELLGGVAMLLSFTIAVGGLHGTARNLGFRLTLSSADQPWSEPARLALGWFVISFVSVIPVFGWICCAYWLISASGALVLTMAVRTDPASAGEAAF